MVAERGVVSPETTTPTRRNRRSLTTLLAVVGVVGASLLVWSASNAAFTASTTNGSNTFAAGTVAITDNDSTGVLFNVTGLKPGATGSSCIRVTYNGDVASAVKLYSSLPGGTGSLDTQITLTIEEGAFSSLPAFPACTGFTPSGAPIYNSLLSTFNAKTTFAAGVGTWTPNGSGQTKDYQFTYTMSSGAGDAYQGASASLTFVWEAQNT